MNHHFFFSMVKSMQSQGGHLFEAKQTTRSISPAEAKKRGMLGPFYHGTSEDVADKIRTGGFKIMVNKPTADRSANPMGEDEGDRGWDGPLHPFGFGVYLCYEKSDARKYAESAKGLLEVWLDCDSSDLLQCDCESEEDWHDFWSSHDYDTDASSVDKRFQSTKDLTSKLEKQHVGCEWEKQGTYLKDVSQVCVYDPEIVYVSSGEKN